MRTLPNSTLALLLILLTGCPSETPDDVLIDDDDTTVADDDDSTVADDDDSTVADDDDSTVADDDDATFAADIEIVADVPVGSVLAVQDGDGPFTAVTVTDMGATFTVTDPAGRYGVLLACAGAGRAGVQIYLSDAATDPAPVLGCAESAERDVPNGLLTGEVLNNDNQVWSYYLGSRPRASVPGTVTEYSASLPVDNYDIVALRRDPNGIPNKMLIQRLLDAGNDPELQVDFNDDGSGVPHTPEFALLDIDSQTASLSTTGIFLSRGGTIWPLGSRTGDEPTFEVLSNERRFHTDLFIFRTVSQYDADCSGLALTVLASERVEDFNTALGGRHGSPIVPVNTLDSTICSDLGSVAVTADAATLAVDWSGGLGPDHELDSLSLELVSPDLLNRWKVTATVGRPVQTVDLADVGALLGADYAPPAAGWEWVGAGWQHPVSQVTGSHLAVFTATDLFSSVPKGRTRFQVEPLPMAGANTGVRDHEYDEDELTREFHLLPWDPIEYTAQGVQRSGTL